MELGKYTIGDAVVPGDVVGEISATEASLRLGAGLQQRKNHVVATRAGLLRSKGGDKFWIESSQKRYVPNEGDLVLGTIIGRSQEQYDVDIGCAFQASLKYENFEKATKKNRPPWEVGDLVYCRVVLANRDMEPELSCMDSRGKSGVYGGLTQGYAFRCSVALCRSLLRPDCVVLRSLGTMVPYEVAVGMNGVVWIRAEKASTTVLLVAAIKNSEYLTDEQVVAMVEKIAHKFA